MALVTRLSPQGLAGLPAAVARPAFDRAALEPGIVHLGLGAFARAHLLPLTEAAMAATGDRRWGVVGVSLRQPDTRDALEPQHGLYTLALRDGSGMQLQVMGSLLRTLVAPEDPEAVLRQLAAPGTRIVSLTVTEKGYHAQPDGAADLVARALQRRRAAGLGGFTVLSLDNLPSNGQVLQRHVSRCAERLDPALPGWIEAQASFPCSMVDRIVPRTTPADRAEVAAALGLDDAWPVLAEPFVDWAVEDRFVAGRPDWALAGARFVDAAEPYERLKLRMVNGAHSALAYGGALLGLATVDQAVAHAQLGAFVQSLMRDEIEPTLPGLDAAAYRQRLLQRFGNPALKHRLLQIAMDGSQKIPQRWLATVRERLAAGQGIARLALCVALWLRFVEGRSEAGLDLPLDDPLAAELKAQAAGAPASLPQVFGDLASNAAFVQAVAGQALRLRRDGVGAALAQAAGGQGS